MKLAIETPSFAVYDDVLQAPAFDRIWQQVQREKYTWVRHQMWLEAWRLSEGSPRAGPVIYSAETRRVGQHLDPHRTRRHRA